MTPASYTYEAALQAKGKIVIGVDEVGRGAIAGPLVAGAVVLPNNCTLELFDSKTVSAKGRQVLAKAILDQARHVGLGWVSNVEIDTHGLAWALKTAYLRALKDLPIKNMHIILDGNVNYLREMPACETLVGADSKVASVAAASIVAKYARDKYMHEQSLAHQMYGYETNVGYGTVSHREAILRHGLCGLHRTTFCTGIIKKQPTTLS